MTDRLDIQETMGGSGEDAPRDSLPPGAMLGQYRIVRLLGRGGMGVVYEAEHTTLGLRYALKLLPSDFAGQRGALERFRQEARVMAQLAHPNIVRVDDFGETEGRYWLRMELVSGVQMDSGRAVSLQDLADQAGGALLQEQVLTILQQVLAGLAYAHAHGAIHRDLKPSNILICTREEGSLFKISDFGLVRLVGEEWVRSRVDLSVQRSLSIGVARTQGDAGDDGTSARSLLGTYEYMSPEQKRGDDADMRSDIYSFGLIAYRLLTGQTHLSFKLPHAIDHVLWPAWDQLVAKTLEPDPAQRSPNCQCVAQLIELVHRAVTGKVDASGRSGPLDNPNPFPSEGRKKR